MKPWILFGLIILPLLGNSQAERPDSSAMVDTAAVIRQVDSLLQVSRSLRRERNFDKALEVSADVERLALEKLGPGSAAYGSCCFNHGRVLRYKGDLPEAEKWHLKARDIQEKALGKEHPDYIWTLNYLGDLYQTMGNYEKSESHYHEAVNLGEKAFGKENSDYAIILDNLAYLYGAMGDLEKAEEFSLKAHAIFERTLGKESNDYAINANMLFNWYLEMAKYEKAEEFCLNALDSWGKVKGKESQEYGWGLDNLANLYSSMGKYEKVEPLYWEALDVFEKAKGKEHGDYIRCANNLVGFLKRLGNYEKAEQLLVEVRDIREKLRGKESPAYSQSLSELASLYHTMGKYDKAELLFWEAIYIREKVFGKDPPENLVILTNLAFLYQDMGNDEKAERIFLQAKPGWEKKPRKEYCSCTGVEHLNDLAGFYHSTGNYEKAELLYLEADTLSEKIWGRGEYPDYPRNLTGRANLYVDMDNYEKAEPLFEELAQLHQSLITSALNYLSERELNNYLNKFSESQAKMLSFAQITADKGTRIQPACYDNILFYKGFLLNTSNQIKRLALSDNIATENFNLLKSYQRRLASEYAKPIAERKNAPELEAKANDLEKELARTVAGYGEALQQVRWQEVQQQLKTGEAAVEFIHYRYYDKKGSDSTMYAALALLPGDEVPQFVPLFEEREIAPFLKNAKGGNIRGINALYSESGQNSLYDLIWQPLEGLLQGAKTVYCSPSGLLHKLNLGAIPLNDGQAFADKHPMVLMNSTRQLVIPNASNDALNDAYVVGGVRYEIDRTIASVNIDLATRSMSPSHELDELPFHADSTSRGDTWNYLPGTTKEALDISQILRSTHLATQLDTGYIASEESFRSLGSDNPSPSVLHIATHGFFFPDPKEAVGSRSRWESGAADSEPVFKMSEHPMMRSGLILAGAQQAWTTGKAPENREDGILTAYEISQMNLSNTELVVLSACETGLGDIEGNEGVYGLQRAFKIAGAKYLIMSLWKVNDQSTRELMIDFYQQWLEKGLTIPDAFRKAQQNIKAKYKDPYHWAGFVLVE